VTRSPIRLAVGLLAVAAGVGLALAQVARPPAVEAVIALRGDSSTAPENTVAALDAAVAAGVTRAWVDVRATADGALVVLADETLDRTTDCDGPVRERTAEALAACDAGSWFDARFAGERVPLLADLLGREDLRLVLELHDVDPAALAGAVEAAGAEARVTVVSATEADVAAVEAAAPGLATWLRVPILDRISQQAAVAAGADGVAPDATTTSADGVEEALRAGLDVVAVDVPDEALLFDVLGMGATAAVTARVRPTVLALGLEFRTYGGPDFGRPNEAGQGFPGPLVVGDFDEDGRDDLVVAAPLDGSRTRGGGWFGVVRGAARFPGPVTANFGAERDGEWGGVLAVGDWNGDGFDDLVAGYPRSDFSGADSGSLWLLDGGPGGIGTVSRPIGPASVAGAHLGAALATLDFNQDGIDDLAVAVPDAAVGTQSAAGRVLLLPGRTGAGPQASGALTIDRATEDVPGDPAGREGFGQALAGGDFDGDGYDDLAIGVTGGDAGAVQGAGSVILVFGIGDDEDGALQTFRIEEVTRETEGVPGDALRGANFGATLAAGDFDGDFFDDLVIGSPDASVDGRRAAGDLVVLYGSAAGWDPERAVAIDRDTPLVPGDATARDRFGATLAVGDVDGDGTDDLVVGVPDQAVAALPGAGAVLVFSGGRRGLRPRVVTELAPGMAPVGIPAINRQGFGRTLALGDLNGDGATDIAVGAPGHTVDGVTEAGALVVAWGYEPALPGVATPTIRPPTSTPEPTVTRTPRPTRTPPPRKSIFMPYAARLAHLERFPTPRAGGGEGVPHRIVPHRIEGADTRISRIESDGSPRLLTARPP